ncbi:MAG: insulinase family protein [Croceibacterium sp.]
MISTSRVLRSLALTALFCGSVPALAQAASAPLAASATPKYSRPDDPWIYRGTDIPIDKLWLFGELPNGVRYAVRRNGVPPGQASIRVRIDAGSLNETESERGFAHLIEHLTFRESKYLGFGEAIPHFERLGARFGADTNAITSPTETVYQLDLPNAQPAAIEDSLKLFSGMIREPTLSAADLAADLPIVMAEGRERGGPDKRVSDAQRELFFAGQPLAARAPIGDFATLQAAKPTAVQAFHDRWYRPDTAVVVLVADADAQLLAGLVERYFGDWKASGPATPTPSFGAPKPPAGAHPANPLGETRVLVEPGQARGITYAYLRPWHGVTDNLEYNRGLLIDSIAESVVNRRLEARARSGGHYLYAGIDRQKISRSADVTYVTLAPLTADWRSALADVRAVIADAIATPPTTAEIDQELANFDVTFANQVEQSRIQAGAQLADDIVSAVDIRESVASPETFLSVFRAMRARFTPAQVHAHTRGLFAGEAIRALMITPQAGEATAAALKQAMLAPVAVTAAVRNTGPPVDFAGLPPIGAPQAPVVSGPLGIFRDLDVEGVSFANGVRALLRRSDNEPGRVTVRVRFGAGMRAFTPQDAVYAHLGEAALVSSGIGPLGQNELDRIVSGRKIGLGFRIEDGAFVLEGLTRADDVSDQLYLLAAKLALPKWDPAPVERAKASGILGYDAMAGDPNSVINRDLDWLLSDRDPRYAQPTPDALRAATPQGFRKVWSRLLSEGPIEVEVFGDFDRDTVVKALSRTFGALPARTPIPADELARPMRFPAANAQPLVLTHRGDADQAAALIAWPTGGGSAGLPQSRKLELLAQILSNRLLDALRERSGASYSPTVASQWPLDLASGGRIIALAQLKPEEVPTFFALADKIADDLAKTGPTTDELARVTEPMLQLLNRMLPAHTFWINQLAGAAYDPNRIAYLPSIIDDYTKTTPAEMQALAAHYLGRNQGFRVAVLPETAATAAAKSAGR